MTQRNVLQVPIDALTATAALQTAVDFLASDRGHLIATINPEMIVAAQTDRVFLNALQQADLRLADGTGVWLASWFLGQPLPARIPGIDFVEALLAHAAVHHQAVYLLGGHADVASGAAKKLTEKFPDLIIAGADSGGVQRPDQWNEEVTATVARAKPVILLVAFGHGKQERWIIEHLSALPTVRVAIGVGGTFNFWAGTAKRAPALVRRFGFEWLWRVCHPNRDEYLDTWRFKRIWRATCVFSWLVVQWKWQYLWPKK